MLVPIVLAIESAQYWHEIFPGGHAISEVVRNIIYGIIAAIIFEWLIVELPAQRRRRAVYEANQTHFAVLVTSGALPLAEYRLFYPEDMPELDARSHQGLRRAARAIEASRPSFFGPERAKKWRATIDAMQDTVAGAQVSQSYMDPDVAQALSIFPTNTFLRRLHITVDDGGNISPELDAHIAWEMVEGSRRLYAALRRRAPDLLLTSVKGLAIKDGQKITLSVRESDLAPPPS